MIRINWPIHFDQGSLGTGILAMANAFNDSGFVVGCIGTIVIGLLCTYCIHQLISAEYELCKRKKIASLNYVGVTELALMEGPKFMQRFSKYAKFVDCMLNIWWYRLTKLLLLQIHRKYIFSYISTWNLLRLHCICCQKY